MDTNIIANPNYLIHAILSGGQYKLQWPPFLNILPGCFHFILFIAKLMNLQLRYHSICWPFKSVLNFSIIYDCYISGLGMVGRMQPLFSHFSRVAYFTVSVGFNCTQLYAYNSWGDYTASQLSNQPIKDGTHMYPFLPIISLDWKYKWLNNWNQKLLRFYAS